MAPSAHRPRRPGPAAGRAERRARRGGRPPARAARARGWCSTRPSRRRSGPCGGRGSAAPCATRPARPRRPAPAGVHRGPGRPARAAARAGARRAPDPRPRGPARRSGTATPAWAACTSGRGWTCALPGATAAAAADRRGDRRPGLLARRVAVGRARRRPRPQRAAAADVPARDDRRLRRAQAPARPRAACSTPASSPTPSRSTQGLRLAALAAAPGAAHRAELRGRGRAGPRRRGLQRQRRLPLARGPTMCPSYQALRDERHSTRGRAVHPARRPRGSTAGRAWPMTVCMRRWSSAWGARPAPRSAPRRSTWRALKVEALAHRHRARGVPLAARLAGHAHELLALGSRVPAPRPPRRRGRRPASSASPPPARCGRGGPRRPIGTSAIGQWHDHGLVAHGRHLHPLPRARHRGGRPARARAPAGRPVERGDPGLLRPPAPVAGAGRRRARRRARAGARRAWRPTRVAGRPIVVLEPSCWSMLVDDLPALLPGDPRARWVADAAVDVRAGGRSTSARRRCAAGAEVARRTSTATPRRSGGGAEGAAALAAVPAWRARASGAGLLRHGGRLRPPSIATCRCGSPRTGSPRPCAAPPASPSPRARPAGSRSAARRAGRRCTPPSTSPRGWRDRAAAPRARRSGAGAQPRVSLWVGRLGLPAPAVRMLRVHGRRTGQLRTTPLLVLHLGGFRYLVAPRGETDWARNLRLRRLG